MTDLAVLKFGGAALADGKAISRACELILAEGAERTVCVVSALKGVTDQLLQACEGGPQAQSTGGALRIRHRSVCRELGVPSDSLDRLWRELQSLLTEIPNGGKLPPAARDLILSFGERASARIVALALRQAGVLATPVDSFDLGFETTPGWTSLAPGVAQRIAPALQQVPGIPVVTGFLAKDNKGNLTNLGRDGSDLTAAVIAEALGADALTFWKDVPGILSADPRLVKGVRAIELVSLGEARELTLEGTQVLHPGTLDGRSLAGTKVRVRSFHEPNAPGTEICEHVSRSGPVVLAANPSLVGLHFAEESPERLQAKLAAALIRLGSARLVARWVAQTGAGTSLWFQDSPLTQDLLHEMPPAHLIQTKMGSITLVGEGIGRSTQFLVDALRDLQAAMIPVAQAQWGTSEFSLRLMVPAEVLQNAAQLLHDRFLTVPAVQPE